MKRIICICLITVLVFGNCSSVVASNMNVEQKEVVVSSEENGFWCKLTEIDIMETRDYARNFSYTCGIYYGETLICTYAVNLTFSYTDSKAIISHFKCTKGDVVPGYTVTESTSTSNGNPAYATLTVKAKENSTGAYMIHTVQFKCKTSGNVDISMY